MKKILRAGAAVKLFFRSLPKPITDIKRPAIHTTTQFPFILEPGTILTTGLQEEEPYNKWCILNEDVNMAFIEKDVIEIT